MVVILLQMYQLLEVNILLICHGHACIAQPQVGSHFIELKSNQDFERGAESVPCNRF